VASQPQSNKYKIIRLNTTAYDILSKIKNILGKRSFSSTVIEICNFYLENKKVNDEEAARRVVCTQLREAFAASLRAWVKILQNRGLTPEQVNTALSYLMFDEQEKMFRVNTELCEEVSG